MADGKLTTPVKRAPEAGGGGFPEAGARGKNRKEELVMELKQKLKKAREQALAAEEADDDAGVEVAEAETRRLRKLLKQAKRYTRELIGMHMDV